MLKAGLRDPPPRRFWAWPALTPFWPKAFLGIPPLSEAWPGPNCCLCGSDALCVWGRSLQPRCRLLLPDAFHQSSPGTCRRASGRPVASLSRPAGRPPRAGSLADSSSLRSHCACGQGLKRPDPPACTPCEENGRASVWQEEEGPRAPWMPGLGASTLHFSSTSQEQGAA